MSTSFNIYIQLDNPTLDRLIGEQLAGRKDFSNDPTQPADCIVTQSGVVTDGTLRLELPKGAIRLGEILDKLRYLLSGREGHIEDETVNLDLGLFLFLPAENLLIHPADGEEIRLTDKERLLVRILYEAGESGLPRRDLLKAVWGYADDAETHTLETHIYRLRQKLEPFGGQNLIKAADGFYVLDIKKPA